MKPTGWAFSTHVDFNSIQKYEQRFKKTVWQGHGGRGQCRNIFPTGLEISLQVATLEDNRGYLHMSIREPQSSLGKGNTPPSRELRAQDKREHGKQLVQITTNSLFNHQ